MPEQAERIIAAVDGSPASVDALRWAVRQANLTGASLEAITCWHLPNQYGYDAYAQDVDWETIAANTLRGAVQQLGETRLEIKQVVLQGHPADVLIRASAGADLLVVGSRGHGGFTGMLLGSVSEHVTAHAQCPVLVIRHSATTTE